MNTLRPTTSQIEKFSFFFIAIFLVGVAVFKLTTPFITILFSYLILVILKRVKYKSVAISIFIVLVLLVFWGFSIFIKEAISSLPAIIEKSLPILIDWFQTRGVDLPFTDVHGLKAVLVESITGQLVYVAKFAEKSSKELIYLIIGLVVAVSLFVNDKIDLNDGDYSIKNNLYTLTTRTIGKRFFNFYQSFVTVMGAQVIISLVNTLFTGIFVLTIGLPYPKLVIGITFLCGLLPIVGNVISNTIICGIGLTVSPNLAMFCLAFLIVLHKFEYFLNSKIIGGRIKNPMWLTLLSLIIGEVLMGIPGMILAPVVLNYIKQECSKIEVT